MNLVEKLLVRGFSISTAESVTGGLISAAIVNMPSASKVFKGGIVCYTKDTKCSMLGINMEDIEKHGVYSHETAKKMALSVKEKNATSVAISTTGVAGPGADEGVEPGTIYYCIVVEDTVYSKYLNLCGDRNEVRKLAVMAILADLEDIIDKI